QGADVPARRRARRTPEGDPAGEQLLPGTARRVRSHCRDVARTPRSRAQRERMERTLAVDGSVGRQGVVARRRLLDERGVLLGLAIVLALFGALVGPQFFRAANLELVARQTVIVCVAALGMTMVIVAGGIDLSVGSVVALSTVATALTLQSHGPVLAAASAIASGAVCGLINGLLVTQLRVVPFIVTLGTMLLVRGAAKGLADERRIEAPVTWLNSLLRTARDGSGLWLPTGIWITVTLAVIVALTLRYTRFGRHLFAIGSSERTARLCGVRINRTKVIVYLIAGACAALAGVMEFSKLSVGDPTVSIGLELDVIAAGVIGGGSVSGGRRQ